MHPQSGAHATDKLWQWRLRLSAVEFAVVNRAGIKSQATDPLVQFKTKGTDTTEWDDELPEIMVSFLRQRGGKINDDHDEDSELLCNCQQRDDIVETGKHHNTGGSCLCPS